MTFRVPPDTPIDLLMEGSKELLVELEMKRWALVSKLRREEEAIHKEIIRLEAEALRAHWLREHRDELLEYGRTQTLQETLKFEDYGLVEPLAIEAPPKRRVANAD